MKDNTQKGPILVLISPILLLIGPILLLIGGAQGTPWALSSLRLWVVLKSTQFCYLSLDTHL